MPVRRDIRRSGRFKNEVQVIRRPLITRFLSCVLGTSSQLTTLFGDARSLTQAGLGYMHQIWVCAGRQFLAQLAATSAGFFDLRRKCPYVTMDAMPRILAVIPAIACVLACASCTAGSHSSPLPVTSTTNLPTATRPVEPSGFPTCGSTSGPQAWAEDVSAAGRVLWRTALTTQSQEVGSVVQPVAASGIAIFADDTSVYG